MTVEFKNSIFDEGKRAILGFEENLHPHVWLLVNEMEATGEIKGTMRLTEVARTIADKIGDSEFDTRDIPKESFDRWERILNG